MAVMVPVDRFSATAGHLQVRTDKNGLPGPNAAVNFDVAPFITHGLGSGGEKVQYYNFDVQPKTPASIFVLFKMGSSTPVEGQLNIVDVIPGEAGYNDFWRVNKVMVPSDYVANAITSAAEITRLGLTIETTPTLVNCPIVPEGSTAVKRYLESESTALHHGWYKGEVVSYFTFGEHALSVDAKGEVPDSDIFVTFKINPSPTNAASGPASGFMAESDGVQTHNVVSTVPEDTLYSPLWDVQVYDNADFKTVLDLTSAEASHVLANSVATVNCPLVVR